MKKAFHWPWNWIIVRWMKTKVLRVLLSGVALMMSGCASEKEAVLEAGREYVVKVESTPFYKYGPQQPGGPDLQLVRGRYVTMIKRGFGFSQVRIDEGTDGYMATDEIEPAPEGPRDAGGVLFTETGDAGSSGLDLSNPAIVSHTIGDEEMLPPMPVTELPTGGSSGVPAPATDLDKPLVLPDFRF